MAKIGAGGLLRPWLEKVKEGPTGRKERRKRWITWTLEWIWLRTLATQEFGPRFLGQKNGGADQKPKPEVKEVKVRHQDWESTWEEVERKGERFQKVSEGKCARKQRGKEKKGRKGRPRERGGHPFPLSAADFKNVVWEHGQSSPHPVDGSGAKWPHRIRKSVRFQKSFQPEMEWPASLLKKALLLPCSS